MKKVFNRSGQVIHDDQEFPKFSENQIISKESMHFVRGGDGGEEIIIIPPPPDKEP